MRSCNATHRNATRALAALLFVALGSESLAVELETSQRQPSRGNRDCILVADYLPDGYVTDGSVNYGKQIQSALDAAAKQQVRTVVFPPIRMLVDHSGIRLPSNATLLMRGAEFLVEESCDSDGAVFVGESVRDLEIVGGEIVGRNDVWPTGANIRGIYLTGPSSRIRIRDMHIRDLSSNGIGIFGAPDNVAHDVWVDNVVIDHCCNKYGDYMSKNPGNERGSTGEDKGLIKFDRVRDFFIRGCQFTRSRSDGTHFLRCQQGQFTNNSVCDSKMGGYFLETCEDIIASDNLIKNNGSRGITIERGARNATVNGCLVSGSGREGLWSADSSAVIVTGNVFDRNGRKPNGNKPHLVWNANITISEAPNDPTKSPTDECIIANNIFYTTDSQVAAIRVEADKVNGIVIMDNLLRGENRRFFIENENKNDGRVIIKDNQID